MIVNEYLSMPDFLAQRAIAQPSRAAIICGTHGKSQTLAFSEWHVRSRAVASGLVIDGIRAGDRVGLLFNGREWSLFAIAFVGVLAAGAVAVPLSDQLPERDLEFILHDCQARLVITGNVTNLRGAVVRCATLESLMHKGTSASAARLSLPEGSPPADDAAQILYTSGTTGRHKGVLATHGNLTYGCTTRLTRRPLRHSEHFLHAFPIGTNAGQVMLMNALDAYPTAVCLPRFLPSEVGATIARLRVGTLFVVPSMATEMLRGESRSPSRPVERRTGRVYCGSVAR